MQYWGITLNVVMNAEKPSSLLNKVHRNSARKMTRTVQLQAMMRPTVQLVYVIGLHAVQFGNNWMKKIPRTAKIGRGRRPSPIWLSEEFFEAS